MATFEATRPAGRAAMAVGIARAAYEYSLDYAKERQAFGKPIIMNQSIAFMLANMCTQIDAARCWCGGPRTWPQRRVRERRGLACRKLYAGRTAVWVTERAIQILGGYGYTREYPVERWHRDAKIMRHLRRHRADPGVTDLALHRPPVAGGDLDLVHDVVLADADVRRRGAANTWVSRHQAGSGAARARGSRRRTRRPGCRCRAAFRKHSTCSSWLVRLVIVFRSR